MWRGSLRASSGRVRCAAVEGLLLLLLGSFVNEREREEERGETVRELRELALPEAEESERTLCGETC